MMRTTFQQDFVGSCTPVSEVQNGENHRRTHYDLWKGHGVSAVLSQGNVQGRHPGLGEPTLIFGWNGCDFHPYVSGTSQTHAEQ